MNCNETQSLLVAWQDGELSPGTAARLAEHVAICSKCREIDHGLRRATPMAGPGLPMDLRQKAWDRIDRALEFARATPTPPPLPVYAERVPLPVGAVVGYALLLVLSLAWGTSNWWTATALRAEVEARRAVAAVPATALPADQYQPAAYAPLPSEDRSDEP